MQEITLLMFNPLETMSVFLTRTTWGGKMRFEKNRKLTCNLDVDPLLHKHARSHTCCCQKRVQCNCLGNRPSWQNIELRDHSYFGGLLLHRPFSSVLLQHWLLFFWKRPYILPTFLHPYHLKLSRARHSKCILLSPEQEMCKITGKNLNPQWCS